MPRYLHISVYVSLDRAPNNLPLSSVIQFCPNRAAGRPSERVQENAIAVSHRVAGWWPGPRIPIY